MISHWCLWLCIQLAATMSPGPAFAMTVRTVMGHGRRAGLFLAVGLALGVGFLMTLVSCGLAVIVARSPALFMLIEYAGAAYLVYIGARALFAKRSPSPDGGAGMLSVRSLGRGRALLRGLITNALNPKGLVFFLAVSTQFVSRASGAGTLALYTATSMTVEACWFSLVAIILTHETVRRRFAAIAHWVERICGGLLLGLAGRLAFAGRLS